ncbi:MAG: MTAP family purine nucleoside phosphorylase [Candidatus Micrarchaeota archaeon]|nr:MTAP family purine nucleoside phosphorylase [Candidatus Micrarchaeota archaeon]
MPAEIGLIGDATLSSLVENAAVFSQSTKYGPTSDDFTVGNLGEKMVAFIPRHGFKNRISPEKVPYRSNIAALKTMTVRRILGTCTVNSLNADYKPGEFVFFDQFVNMTSGRAETFFDEDGFAQVSTAEPYCPELRELAAKTADGMGMKYHKAGTVVVVNGPRMVSKAESSFFSSQGFHVIDMVQYPEVALARESGICYLGMGIVTGYDACMEGKADITPMAAEGVSALQAKAKEFVLNIVPKIPETQSCSCSKSLEGTVQTKS